jgi:lipopolysaccharide export LptBFGC system permease protein LptF
MLERIPLLYRYLIKKFSVYFFLFLSGGSLVSFLFTLMLFYNSAKVKSFSLAAKYALNSVVAFFPVFFGLAAFLTMLYTAYRLIGGKIPVVVFSLGFSPRVLLIPFFSLGVILSILLLLFFQYVYPAASYGQFKAYLEGKKKSQTAGVARNVWFKRGKTFLNISLLNLGEKKAYGGTLFEVDKDFRLRKVESFPLARMVFENGHILLFPREVFLFTKGGEKKLSNVEVSFPYNPKLLSVKRPQFFSMTELLALLKDGGRLGINTNPYAWELIKRILLSFLVFWIFTLLPVKLLTIFDFKDFKRRLKPLSAVIVLFYAGIFIFQSVVFKTDLSPFWGIFLIALPLLAVFVK